MEMMHDRLQRHLSCLNKEISSLWDVERKLAMADLPEFMYALDHLDEITCTTHFKSNRILETHDTYRLRSQVNRAFNDYRLHSKDTTWKIKTVGPGTWDAIAEFLERDYVNVLFRVMRATTNNKLEITLDGQKYIVRLEIKTPHALYGVLEYTNVGEKKVLKLPFFLTRLSKSLPSSAPRLANLAFG
ncbi:hypothetical protein D3C79_48960 [compost metagenome]